MTPQKVYALRQRHGLTIDQFARVVYTTPRVVQRWESGKAEVCPARFELAAMKLHDHDALEAVEVPA